MSFLAMKAYEHFTYEIKAFCEQTRELKKMH